MLMQKNKSRRIVTLILLLLLIALCVFIGLYNLTTNETESHRSVQPSNSVLERNLTQATTLGGNKLTDSKRNKLLKLNARLSRDGFFGSYIATKNSDLEFSAKIGYAHVGTKDIFRLNTAYLIGEYQDAINSAILLRLVEKNELSLSKSLQYYLPGLKSGSEVTVKDLVLGKTNLTINSGWFSQYMQEDKSGIDFGKVKLRSTSAKYVSANPLITKNLISAVTGESYSSFVTKQLETHFGLSETRVVTDATNSQVNDATGYSYYKDRTNKVVQGKAIDVSDLPSDNYYIRMSLVDIAMLTNKIQTKKAVPSKYTNIYQKALNNLDGFSKKASGWQLETAIRGQYLVIRTNANNSKMLIVTSNLENKKVNISKLNTTLYGYID